MDGAINDSVIHTFTHGQCHSLAGAVLEMTGWPVVILTTELLWYPLHFGNLHPSGNIIDIRGMFSFDDWRVSLNDQPFVQNPQIVEDHPWSSLDFIRRINQTEHEYNPPNFELARLFAPILLESVSCLR
jgi:hypothetical protein